MSNAIRSFAATSVGKVVGHHRVQQRISCRSLVQMSRTKKTVCESGFNFVGLAGYVAAELSQRPSVMMGNPTIARSHKL